MFGQVGDQPVRGGAPRTISVDSVALTDDAVPRGLATGQSTSTGLCWLRSAPCTLAGAGS